MRRLQTKVKRKTEIDTLLCCWLCYCWTSFWIEKECFAQFSSRWICFLASPSLPPINSSLQEEEKFNCKSADALHFHKEEQSCEPSAGWIRLQVLLRATNTTDEQKRQQKKNRKCLATNTTAVLTCVAVGNHLQHQLPRFLKVRR